MVQFLSIIFFLGFLQFLLGFSKVPVFLCHSVDRLANTVGDKRWFLFTYTNSALLNKKVTYRWVIGSYGVK